LGGYEKEISFNIWHFDLISAAIIRAGSRRFGDSRRFGSL
jgi:hypothetical protein